MDDIDIFKSWFKENNTQDIEVFVPDMAGIARGKVIPTQKFCKTEIKMAESVFGQTISGNYIEDESNPEDRDMILKPDVSTLHPVPWLKEPTASVICDCLTKDNKPVETSPRRILRNILKLYTEKGWKPIVAPEVEFYLIRPHSDFNAEVAPPKGRLGRTDTTKQPLSIDAMNDFDPFINDVYAFCEKQDIHIDTLSQEMGPSQFEINFYTTILFPLPIKFFFLNALSEKLLFCMSCTSLVLLDQYQRKLEAPYIFTKAYLITKGKIFFHNQMVHQVNFLCIILVACKNIYPKHC